MNDNVKNCKSRTDTLIELVSRAKNIACLTGAGISTDSGIPDFRSSTGLYNSGVDMSIFDLDAFLSDPVPFYRVIGPFTKTLLSAQPNVGHRALAKFETMGKRVRIATQNIDDLHQQAGSHEVYSLHGTMSVLKCLKCQRQVRTTDYLSELATGTVIRHDCGGVFKPMAVFFQEQLPELAVTMSVEAFSSADLVLVIGTSLNVYPAAALPTYRSPNVPVVIINRDPTPYDSQAELVFHAPICDVLTEVVERL